MKAIHFAIAGAAALALSACSSGNEDTVNSAEVNQATDNLDAMAGTAADDAANAEAVALGTQEQQLEAENAAAASDNATNPTDEDEQNVAGM